MRALGTLFLLWSIHAAVGAALAAPILFLGRKRVGWAKWELLTLIIPFGIWVIYDEGADGEFLAVSKFGKWTIQQQHVKQVITQMHGTDIGTYDIKP